MPATEKDDAAGLDSLRAIAALCVLWYHFTQGNQLKEPWLRASGQFGWVGAHMFFVISGFVIPWALDRGGYDLRSWPRFMAKRMMRLHPPYLASIVIVQVLGVLSTLAPGFQGPPYAFKPYELALHFFYANEWLGFDWALPVYWTLAIEVQYYAVVGLLFPILASPVRLTRCIALLALNLGTVLVTDKRFVFGYGAFFVLGFAAFLFRRERIPAWEYALYTVTAALALLPAGPVHFAGGTAMAGAVLLLRRPIPGLAWLGPISYSFYLLHIPFGSRVLNLGARLDLSPPLDLVLLVAAIGCSLIATAVFYRYVERPAQLWSKRIGYGTTWFSAKGSAQVDRPHARTKSEIPAATAGDRSQAIAPRSGELP